MRLSVIFITTGAAACLGFELSQEGCPEDFQSQPGQGATPAPPTPSHAHHQHLYLPPRPRDDTLQAESTIYRNKKIKNKKNSCPSCLASLVNDTVFLNVKCVIFGGFELETATSRGCILDCIIFHSPSLPLKSLPASYPSLDTSSTLFLLVVI